MTMNHSQRMSQSPRSITNSHKLSNPVRTLRSDPFLREPISGLERKPLSGLPKQPRRLTNVTLQPIDPTSRGFVRPNAPLPSVPRRGSSATATATATAGSPFPVLPAVRMPGRSADVVTSGLSWSVQNDVRTLIEVFVKKQRDNESDAWLPIRAPTSHCVYAMGLNKKGSMLERWASSNYGTWTGGLTSDCFSLEGADSFEAVLRCYFRTVSPEELEAMLTLAEPAIKWAMEADARRRWIKEQRALYNQILNAFPNEKDNTVGELCVDSFVEAVGLHRQGVSPELAARTLEILQHADVTLGADQRLDELHKAANDDNTIDAELLIESVAWHPSLRAAFSEIVVLGSAVRTCKMLAGGYRESCRRVWKAASLAATCDGRTRRAGRCS